MARQTTAVETEKRPRFLQTPIPRPRESQGRNETLQPLHIVQFSMGIACLEEGRHIDRMMAAISASPLPPTTDFFIAISDNGSRGAWQLIESEAGLTTQRQTLEDALSKRGLEGQFHQVIAQEEALRKLQLGTIEGSHSADSSRLLFAALTERNAAIISLSKHLPTALSDSLFSYSLSEDQHRIALAQALQHPEEVVAQTDRLRTPLLPNQEPSQEQLDTIRAYARIFLGKYDDPTKNLRIGIVQGSDTGSFGSVKRYALEAARKDFKRHHPNTDPKQSVIMIGDMDTHIDPLFVPNTIQAFAHNPEKNALLANTYLVEERNGAKQEIVLRRLPMPDLVSRIFMDQTNMRDFIVEQGRSPRQFLPEGHGRLRPLRYHLHPGPALIFRGDVFENLTIPTTDGQGEDIALTMRYQRKHGTSQTLISPDASYGFNLRGHNLFKYLLNPVEGWRFLQTRRDAITPYQHIRLRASMSAQEYAEFLDSVPAHMTRRLLLRDMIRQFEEEQFALDPHEYIVRRQENPSKLPKPQRGEHIKPGYNSVTNREEWALVRHASQEINLGEHEFVAGGVTDRQLHHPEKGERIVSVSVGFDARGKSVVKHFLVSAHLDEPDFDTLPFIVAETLSTHHGRLRRAASLPK